MKPIEMEIVRITPAIAEKLMEKNYECNRAVKSNNLKMIIEDMQSGNWVLSHQGIALDPDGYVFDGQHRLLGVIKSGCTVKMCVFKYTDWDVAKAVFPVLDIGSRRTTRDAAVMNGETHEFMRNNKMIATAKRLMWFRDDVRYGTNLVISNKSVFDYMRQNEDLLDQTYRISRSCSNGMNATVLTAIALALKYGEPYEDLYNFVDTFINKAISFPGKGYNCKMALDAKEYTFKMKDTSGYRKQNVINFENYIYAYIHGLEKIRTYKERYPYNTILEGGKK